MNIDVNPFRSMLRRTAPLVLAVPAIAQVTDPAVVTGYGTDCGVTIDAGDTIQPDGSHGLAFTAGLDPFGIALLVLGFDTTDIPLPNGCHVLADPLILDAAVANSSGDASFPVSLPATVTGHLYAQAASLGAGLDIETSRGLDLLFPGFSPTPDPTTEIEYPCYYIQNLTWNYGGDGVGNVVGKVRWPSATCNSADGPPAGRPILIFLHGNGMDYQDHDYLMAHLARNGFVTCSIENGSYLGGSNEGRAREAISYLNSMNAYWGWRSRLNGDVVFAGHSRGAEAAITASRLLRDNPSMAHVPYDVEAVLSIAPTDGGGDNSDPKEVIDGNMTRAFFGLYGTHDPDVRGIRLEDPLVGPENTVFAIYDRAGTESSVEGILWPQNNVTKSLMFVGGATHRGFMDGCSLLEGGTIGCAAHKDVAKAYFNAFLHWQVLNETAYQAYFDGRAVPTSVRVAAIETFPEFSRPHKRVVDNFEQGGLNVNTRGGAVTTNAGIAVVAENELWTMDPSAPHDTSGLRVKWSNGTARMGWEIPAANVSSVGPARDVTGFSFLSLRAAQDYLDAWNVAGEDQDFSLRLYTGAGWSNYVRVGDYGRIPYPTYFYTHPWPYPAGDYTKSALSTIRVPLDAFSNVDLTDVRWVYVYFNVPGHTAGSVMLDSLEFVD